MKHKIPLTRQNTRRHQLLCVLILPIFLSCCAGVSGTRLYRPAQKGDIAKLKTLLKSRENPNAQKRGFLPLFGAVQKSQFKAAQFLIENGADVNADNGNGTPLVLAACKGDSDMVKLLLKNGADPEKNGYCIKGFEELKGSPGQIADKAGHPLTAAILQAAMIAKAGVVPSGGGVKLLKSYQSFADELVAGCQQDNAIIAVADLNNYDGRTSSSGNIVAERLTTELIKKSQFKITERKTIEKIFSELKFQASGFTNPDTAKDIGKILGADYIITGTVTDLPDGLLEINARLVSVQSGTAVSATSGQILRDWQN